MHLSTDEIKVDLNEKYEWKYDYNDILTKEYKIIYSIDNAEKDVTFTFKYKETIEGKKVQNPFEVCHGEECQKGVTTYDFEKGESYKIYATAANNVLPSYSFHDKNKKDDDESESGSDSNTNDDNENNSNDENENNSNDDNGSNSNSNGNSGSNSNGNSGSNSNDDGNGKNYCYYLSLNLWVISILLLFL